MSGTDEAAICQLGRVLLYARNMERTAAFYVGLFGFTAVPDADGRILELHSGSGPKIMIHQAAKSQVKPQSRVKLVFDVRDVAQFVAAAKVRGIDFGPVHQAAGYSFANCRDPDGTPVSVSSREFRSGLPG